LNLLKLTDEKIGTTTKEIKAGEIQISRVDLLLKRAIVLLEQANGYWNVVSKNSDINMYRTKLKEASRLLQEATQLDQFNTEVLLYMAKVQGKLMPSNPNKMREILYRIQSLLGIPHNDTEKFHLAQAIFMLATSEKPIDDESVQDAREMFKGLGRRDWVRQCDDLLQFTEIVSAKAWYNKGLALDSLDRYEQAIECFDKAIQIDANNLVLFKNKGTALHYLGRYGESVACFDKAIQIDAHDGDAWSGKGLSFDYLGRYEEAIECFDKAIESNPKNDDAWYNKGVAADFLRKYEEAIVCYDKAIDINPDNAVAWHGRGTSLRKMGKYQEAIVCYDKAIDINPDNAVAWHGRGLALDRLGNHKEGKESIDKAKRLGL
jgi:tetratricopeptide (TPR) repeat protein